MKFPSAAEQMKDNLSLLTWFREVIRVRNAFPAIARGTTEGVDSLSDDNVAAFIRRDPENGDLLIVMAAVLNTGEEDITYEQGVLTMPGYSIAVFTLNDI